MSAQDVSEPGLNSHVKFLRDPSVALTTNPFPVRVALQALELETGSDTGVQTLVASGVSIATAATCARTSRRF